MILKWKNSVLVATDIFLLGVLMSMVSPMWWIPISHPLRDYIHRIGRTGRAKSEGVAISFITGDDVNPSEFGAFHEEIHCSTKSEGFTANQASFVVAEEEIKKNPRFVRFSFWQRPEKNGLKSFRKEEGGKEINNTRILENKKRSDFQHQLLFH